MMRFSLLRFAPTSSAAAAAVAVATTPARVVAAPVAATPVAALTPAASPVAAPKAAAEKVPLKHTQLHDFHVSQSAKMVPYAGWHMPVEYAGVFTEHLYTRSNVSLFDVSHMGQVRFFGADREKFVEWVTVADIAALPMGKGRLAVVLNEAGGIKDDLIVTRYHDHVYTVINAARAEADIAYFTAQAEAFRALGFDVAIEVGVDLALVAFQGPQAAAVLSRLVDGIDDLPFMASRRVAIKGIPARIMRCGYTGEDGYEISVANCDVQVLTGMLFAQPETRQAGLGARDSLRIESGLCLYGAELTEAATPIAAKLGWLITKRRMAEGCFVGHGAIAKLKANPELAPLRRVGITSTGPCARGGAVVQINGEHVGDITSGCPSPTLGRNVAMAYVQAEHSKPGTAVTLMVRNRKVQGEITTMPFVPTNYRSATPTA
jgi:aminomethyltransferase